MLSAGLRLGSAILVVVEIYISIDLAWSTRHKATSKSFPKLGGPHNDDYSISGSILGPPF